MFSFSECATGQVKLIDFSISSDPIVVQGNWLSSQDYPWMVSYRLLNSH